MEYTKGEWKARKSPMGDWIVCSPDELVCREVRHYNAHLIASAPDLYEALKAIDGYLSASFPANLTRKKHAVELLDKALAKAGDK